MLIVCARQVQNTIQDSVHRLLSNQIRQMGLNDYFKITQNSIKHHLTGSEFIYKGLNSLSTDSAAIKSLEGADVAWVAEAQNVNRDAWKALIPTIRKPGSEIWVEFNTGLEEEETYQRFVVNTPPDTLLKLVNYYDNPHFPEVLEKERQYAFSLIASARDDMQRAQAQADYDNIWLGAPSKIKQAAILRSKVVIQDFPTPEGVTFYHGADWGFANDPSVLIRCFIQDECLYIDYEAYGYGVEIDHTPALFDTIPTARKWPIKADSARPETISYMKRQGFNITAADKWKGSVEDGIAHLKGFKVIYIHTRCPRIAEESRNYCYKLDKNTGEILPEIVDAWNHGWDAARYSLDKYIKKKNPGIMSLL